MQVLVGGGRVQKTKTVRGSGYRAAKVQAATTRCTNLEVWRLFNFFTYKPTTTMNIYKSIKTNYALLYRDVSTQ